MSATTTTLGFTDAQRAALAAAMARGVRMVQMPDGSRVEYADLAEMQAVLDRDTRERNAAAGAPATTFATWSRD